ncbi:MAG TPA: hypothetical protein VJB91_02950 [Patescibacteria group bacterium]|nr:hypothetical protein [Patescibacteria group bacterium]
MKSIREILLDRTPKQEKYISQEFQDYGYRLAESLRDVRHKALYIKLAKEIPRFLLEEARVFAIDYPRAQHKGKIFMWKLTQLKKEHKKKQSKK